MFRHLVASWLHLILFQTVLTYSKDSLLSAIQDQGSQLDCDSQIENACESVSLKLKLQPDWEFEPRIWAPDQDETSSWDQNIYPNEESDAAPRRSTTSSDLGQERALNRADIRRDTHFYEARIKHMFQPANHKSKSSQRSSFKLRQQQEEETCDQFRVDIRETVICDRQRCDRSDFEWPKHDNQMVVVQTTKAGMRFYQAHLQFEPPSPSLRRTFVGSGAERENLAGTSKKIPIKFDILDLFKPKPTTTTTTTTLAPLTTPSGNSTDPSTTEDQFGKPNVTSPSPVQGQREAELNYDTNRTRLVTTFRLDTRRRVQKILGFGGALSDSSCRNIKSLSPTMAKNLMEDYFGPKGLQYTLVRMSMGSSDFSLTPYTNNDKPYGTSRVANARPTVTTNRQDSLNGTDDDDVEMKYFHLTEEDFDIKIPLARQAIATSKRQLKFFSSLWSPPIWMKNNSHIVHGYLKGDVYGPYYKALADLIVKWLEAYRDQGIEFWATTGLNEPITGVRPFIFHNSLGITREDYVTWIKLYLGPMLKQQGLQNVKLLAVDDNKGYMQSWVGSLLEDNEVAKYISGVAVHWYMNDDYENLNFLINRYPDKFILSTEACNGYYPFQVHVLPGDWDRGVAYMYDIMKMMHKNAVGWVDWNMALNIYGGPSWPGNFVDSPVLVNSDRDEYYKSPSFYAIGHFSRFVVPGSRRLDHRLANARYDHPIEASGFLTPDDYVVIVVLNANKHKVPFKVIVDRRLVRIVDLNEESFNTIIFKWKANLT